MKRAVCVFFLFAHTDHHFRIFFCCLFRCSKLKIGIKIEDISYKLQAIHILCFAGTNHGTYTHTHTPAEKKQEKSSPKIIETLSNSVVCIKHI